MRRTSGPSTCSPCKRQRSARSTRSSSSHTTGAGSCTSAGFGIPPLNGSGASYSRLFRPGTWITGVRGHALHPLAGRQVEARDAFGREVDGPAPVLVEWAECNRQAAETFRDVYPPTAYFPLIVSEQLMIEPIGTESRESIERLANALIAVAEEARAGPLMLLRIG
jgi:hypothetical protein